MKNVLVIENVEERKQQATRTFGKDMEFSLTIASSYDEAFKLIDAGTPRFHLLIDGINNPSQELAVSFTCADKGIKLMHVR